MWNQHGEEQQEVLQKISNRIDQWGTKYIPDCDASQATYDLIAKASQQESREGDAKADYSTIEEAISNVDALATAVKHPKDFGVRASGCTYIAGRYVDNPGDKAEDGMRLELSANCTAHIRGLDTVGMLGKTYHGDVDDWLYKDQYFIAKEIAQTSSGLSWKGVDADGSTKNFYVTTPGSIFDTDSVANGKDSHFDWVRIAMGDDDATPSTSRIMYLDANDMKHNADAYDRSQQPAEEPQTASTEKGTDSGTGSDQALAICAQNTGTYSNKAGLTATLASNCSITFTSESGTSTQYKTYESIELVGNGYLRLHASSSSPGVTVFHVIPPGISEYSGNLEEDTSRSRLECWDLSVPSQEDYDRNILLRQ